MTLFASGGIIVLLFRLSPVSGARPVAINSKIATDTSSALEFSALASHRQNDKSSRKRTCSFVAVETSRTLDAYPGVQIVEASVASTAPGVSVGFGYAWAGPASVLDGVSDAVCILGVFARNCPGLC